MVLKIERKNLRQQKIDAGFGVEDVDQGANLGVVILYGPMGGCRASLDGRGVDFIGHGREFVARKPGGGAFVIPFETPDTITDPGLTNKRIAQAMKGGYNLKEMSSGGWINGPESGYLGSFTGARPEFIGHGLFRIRH